MRRAAVAARCEISTAALFGTDARAAGAARSAIGTVRHAVTDAARRLRTPRGRRVGSAALAAATLAYVTVVDPHRATGVRPPCPVKAVTGLDCPACGGMRMAHDIVHGDVRTAIRDNAFLLACSPLLAALLWRGVVTNSRESVPPAVAQALGAGALAWMVLRNIPRWPLKPTLRR